MQLFLSLLIIFVFLWLLFNHPFKSKLQKSGLKENRNKVKERGL